MSVGASSRSEDDLTEAQRRELDAANEQLRAAASAYEAFLGTELTPGEPLVAANAKDVLKAQERVEAAEEHLWQLRERLLGWSRPPWAPPASLVADWFSSDDDIYDQVTNPSASCSPMIRGDIYLAPFTYADLRGSKRRPVCLVSSARYHADPDVNSRPGHQQQPASRLASLR